MPHHREHGKVGNTRGMTITHQPSTISHQHLLVGLKKWPKTSTTVAPQTQKANRPRTSGAFMASSIYRW